MDQNSLSKAYGVPTRTSVSAPPVLPTCAVTKQSEVTQATKATDDSLKISLEAATEKQPLRPHFDSYQEESMSIKPHIEKVNSDVSQLLQCGKTKGETYVCMSVCIMRF